MLSIIACKRALAFFAWSSADLVVGGGEGVRRVALRFRSEGWVCTMGGGLATRGGDAIYAKVILRTFRFHTKLSTTHPRLTRARHRSYRLSRRRPPSLLSGERPHTWHTNALLHGC
jgi:hypothetical protein